MNPITVGDGTDVQTFDSVSALGDFILREHSALLMVRKNYSAKRRHFGAVLNQVKGSFDHGQWLPWLRSLGINVRRAQACMAAAAGKAPIKSALSAHFGGRLGEQNGKCAFRAHLDGSETMDPRGCGKVGTVSGPFDPFDDRPTMDVLIDVDDRSEMSGPTVHGVFIDERRNDDETGGGYDADQQGWTGGGFDEDAEDGDPEATAGDAGASVVPGGGVDDRAASPPAKSLSAPDANETPQVVGRIMPRPIEALTTRVITPKRLPGGPMLQLTLDAVYELVAATRVQMDRLAGSTGAVRDRFEEATRRYQVELAGIEADEAMEAAQ